MIAWMIAEFSLCDWIEDKQADVGRNYCELKCIFGNISISKGGTAEILRIRYDYDVYLFKRMLS